MVQLLVDCVCVPNARGRLNVVLATTFRSLLLEIIISSSIDNHASFLIIHEPIANMFLVPRSRDFVGRSC